MKDPQYFFGVKIFVSNKTDDKIQTYGRRSGYYKWYCRGTNSYYYRNNKNASVTIVETSIFQ